MTLHNLESLWSMEMERWGIVQVQSQNLGFLNGPLDQSVSLHHLQRKKIMFHRLKVY